MLIRNRQGWRLPVVISRPVLAGVLAAGVSLLLPPDVLQAQTERAAPPQPPPTHQPRPPDSTAAPPAQTSAPPPVPHRPADPTPAESPNADGDTPTLLTLPPALERLARRRNALNQVLCKDRRHHLLLSRGDQALATGDITTALQNFQALSEADRDAFVWPADSSSPCGACLSVHQRFRALPTDARRTCERIHGGKARVLEHDAAAQNDRALRKLLRHYPHTDAGRAAMRRELLRAYDAGQTALAAQYADRLSADPHHWQQLSPNHRSLIRRILDSGDRSPAHASVPAASPPALRPQWTYSFTDGIGEPASATSAAGSDDAGESDDTGANVPDIVNHSFEEWLAERRERRFPAATANQAALFGDLLVVRDFTGIAAMDIQSGRSQWQFPTIDSFATAAAVHREKSGSGTALNFQTHFSGQGPRGQLACDGRLVFFLDEVPADLRPGTGNEDGKSAATVNRLVALPLHPGSTSPEAVWTQPDPDDPTLAGHFFLGPPLPMDGRLFVLSEFAGRLECIALDAGDGRVLWRQPIALTPCPIDWDSPRQRIACTPRYAGSTVVCPTEVGVLVGVDPLTGSLRWVYDHIDEDQRHSSGRWSSSTQRNFGSCELPSRTLVLNDRVLHLPFRCTVVHCVDAATGTEVWTAPRNDALGLSVADDQNVLLIGQREVTSLSPADGSLQWTASCPEPAGHGIFAGDAYLVPLADGRCQAFSLEDGTPRGGRFGKLLHELAMPEGGIPSPQEPAVQLIAHQPGDPVCDTPQRGGNLLCAGDRIVMTRPTQVAVYPAATSLLAMFDARAEARRLSDQQQLDAASLHLLLEDHLTARQQLQSLVQTSGSPSVTRRAARLLRELLYDELEAAEKPRSVLARLEQLPGDDADALRLLVHRIDIELQLGDASRLIAALEEFRRHRNESVNINRDGDGTFTVNACSEVSDRLAELRSANHEDLQTELNRYIGHLVEQTRDSDDPAEWARVVRLFSGWPGVGRLRNRLARSYSAAGRLQEAELLLLQNCEDPDRRTAAQAHRLLVELYHTSGLQRETAAHLLALDELYGDLNVDDDPARRPGEEVGQQQKMAEASVRELLARRRQSPPPAYNVQISEHVCSDACGTERTCASEAALAHHQRIRRKFLTSAGASLSIIDRGTRSADRSRSELALVNRDTGRLHGEIDVPAAYWQLAGSGRGYCGGLLPISGRSAHGLSLLEQRCVWSLHRDEDNQRDKMKVGPIGCDYCVLQSSRRLSVIHPATGELLWSRDNLAPDVGLLSNDSTGIIGDEQTLTLFDADQLSYTVFRTRSGRLVRRGRLDVPKDDSRRHRRAIGDRLVHLVSGEQEDRLRVWDAGKDEMLFDIALHGRLYSRIAQTGQYACVSAAGELTVLDLESGQIVIRAPVSDELLGQAGELDVAADPERYLVCLAGCEPDPSGNAAAAMDEVELPAMRVGGQLLAVSRSGEVHWSRPVPDAALLTHPWSRLPVLTLISRVRDPEQRQSTTLRVEVLDIRSGESLTVRSDLLRTRFVQFDDRRKDGLLKLIGLDSQVEIAVGTPLPPMLIHAEVDPAGGPLTR